METISISAALQFSRSPQLAHFGCKSNASHQAFDLFIFNKPLHHRPVTTYLAEQVIEKRSFSQCTCEQHLGGMRFSISSFKDDTGMPCVVPTVYSYGARIPESSVCKD
jgi:hypothetical protein